MTSLGQRIALARNGKGLSPQEFAERFKPRVTYESVRAWEKDEHPPRKKRMQEILSITGVREPWLLAGVEPMYADGTVTKEARADYFVSEAEDLPPEFARPLLDLIAAVRRVSARPATRPSSPSARRKGKGKPT